MFVYTKKLKKVLCCNVHYYIESLTGTNMETVGIILCLVTLYSIAMTAVVCFAMKMFRDTRRELREEQESNQQLQEVIQMMHEDNQELRDANWRRERQVDACMLSDMVAGMKMSQLQAELAAAHAAGAACQ